MEISEIINTIDQGDGKANRTFILEEFIGAI
jgi:hypothetical protein